MHHENFCKLPIGDVRTKHQLVTTDQEFPLDVSMCPNSSHWHASERSSKLVTVTGVSHCHRCRLKMPTRKQKIELAESKVLAWWRCHRTRLGVSATLC